MKDKKKRGFTLVELLATIVVIALIFSIAIFFTSRAIRGSKENTYKVTIKEIEKNADSYLLENNNRLSFIIPDDEDKNEYQCITVENLINYGYLDKNITESLVNDSTKVLISDYIYVERDRNSKAVIKSEYVNKSNKTLYDLCGGAVIAQKDSGIKFIANPGFNTWSTYKDITIEYTLKNVNDVRTASKYDYNHSFTKESTYDPNNDSLEYVTKKKVVRVLDNGTLYADISLNGKEITKDSKEIDHVDIIGPEVENNYNGGRTVSRSVTIPLKVTDFGIGVDYDTFTTDDVTVTVGGTVIDGIQLTHIGGETYNLKINNTIYDGDIKIEIAKDKIFDKLQNGNNAITINTGVSFNNIYRIINNQITVSVKSKTNVTISETTDTASIYVDPYN